MSKSITIRITDTDVVFFETHEYRLFNRFEQRFAGCRFSFPAWQDLVWLRQTQLLEEAFKQSMRKTGAILFLLSLFMMNGTQAAESVCYGTTSNGRLENGVQLPAEGKNFISYGTLPEMAGRTYVHSKVRDIIVDAYRALEKTQPGKVYKYAETGLETGGRFKPHKSHRNGLSVDFMVPVTNKAGRSVHLPTSPLNRYGYDIEFDAKGHYEEYAIDYEALAAHLVALHKSAVQHGAGIWRVIFDPQLAPNLYSTPSGPYLRQHVTLQKTKSWVRHDEHYHVDFQIECRPL